MRASGFVLVLLNIFQSLFGFFLNTLFYSMDVAFEKQNCIYLQIKDRVMPGLMLDMVEAVNIE